MIGKQKKKQSNFDYDFMMIGLKHVMVLRGFLHKRQVPTNVLNELFDFLYWHEIVVLCMEMESSKC